jgi:hypothetical protein
MPLLSKRQMRWMFANKPRMAREWLTETPNPSRLPERAPRPTSAQVKKPRLEDLAKPKLPRL